MKGRFKSLLACVLAVLLINSCIMPDLTFAEVFSNVQSESQGNSPEAQSVTESVYETPTPIPETSTTIGPVVTFLPEVTLIPTPVPEVSTDFPDEESSIILPIEESGKAQNSVIADGYVTKTAKVLNTSFAYRDAPLTESEPDGESIREIKENQVITLNDEDSTQKDSYVAVAFTPTTSATYIVTASEETLNYMYILDNKNDTIISLRTYPEYGNSVACKLYKDHEYKICLDVNENLPTQLRVEKYESMRSELVYKFSDNTYVEEEKASILVDMPSLPADILFAALERDIIFSAELIKDGVMIDKITEIPKDCIRGGTGTPEDNNLQFVCNFSKYIESDEYTVRITCNDLSGNPVIESCEADIELGNKLTIYVPENEDSIAGYGKVYINKTNTNTGKFLLMNDGKAIGMSDFTYIRNTTIEHDFISSNYLSTKHEYNEDNFVKNLYYADIPDINFNGTLKKGKEYNLKLVTGTSEYAVSASVFVTDALVVENIYHSWDLRETSDNYIVTANFSNIKNVDAEKINVEMVDMYGKVVASKVNYSYSYDASEIKFRLKIHNNIELNNIYSIKISYPGELYINAQAVKFWAYNYDDKLRIEAVKVADVEKGEITVSTKFCDKSIDYEVVLYRYNNSLYIPISNITQVRPDEDGVFSLQFSHKSDLQLLTEGGTYELRFLYDGYLVDSKEFSIPVFNHSTDVDKKISFYPPVLPSEGDVEITISGYEIGNGIMGANNESINIELVADNEVYGSMDNASLEKSVSVYRMNGSYNVGYVMLKGMLNITKALKDETKYFIRINGTNYEYFFNSQEQKIYPECFRIEGYNNENYSSFKDSDGNSQIYYILNNSEQLKLSSSWVRGVSENAELVFVNVYTKEEIKAGIWNTDATYYNGTVKEISIDADLSKVIPGDIYEICLRDSGQNYSFKKYIQFPEAMEANYFTVSEAVYGSDVVTLYVSRSNTIDNYSFNILDSLDNIINCTRTSERVDSQRRYIDLKLDETLKYGFYKIQMFNGRNVFKNAYTYYVSEKKVAPSLQYVKEGYPYLIYGENLKAEASYTADIYEDDTIERMKRDIRLTKRTDEDVLEIDQRELESLPIGRYSIAVKADGILVGSQIFYYNGSFELKPVISASEWEEGTARRPFISSNNVKFDLRTLYYTKVRYAQSVEELITSDYQTVTEDVYYVFDNTDRLKTLYFQFSDDYKNESDVSIFKAYLSDHKNDITIISPKENSEYYHDLSVLAKVANNPYYVGAVLYKQGNSILAKELIRTEGTDNYSNTLSNGSASMLSAVEDNSTRVNTDLESYLNKGTMVEVFTADEVGNIIGSKVVKLKSEDAKYEEISYVSLKTQIGEKKSDLNVKGNTTNGAGNITIYAYANRGYYYDSHPTYSITLLADDKGDFEGTLNIPVDGDYKIIATDFKATQSYRQYNTIDTRAPVLKEYSTVAQGIDSVRISWAVTDASYCYYTIWKNGNILTGGYDSTEYIAVGLTKGETCVYRIMATDIVGNNSEPVEISVTFGDEEAPSAPQNLTVSSHASKSITLSWDASTDNSYVAGYEIFRNGEKAGISYTTEFTDEKLETGVEYSYKLRAFDPSMNFSGFTESIIHSPKVTDISDAYDGDYSVVGHTTKKLVLKALTSDSMNKKGITVLFEYQFGKSTYWTRIDEKTDVFTSTPNGLLFSTTWNVQYLNEGDYTIRYTLKDRDGYTSEAFTKVISILKAEDNEAPKIVSIKPDPSCFADSIPLTITVEDNIRVRKVTVQTSLDGTDWSDYKQRDSSSIGNRIYMYFEVDVSAIREGFYYVRAIAEDSSGNVSNSTNTYNQYVIDRTAPEKVQNISAYSYVDFIEIKWNNNSEPYVSGFSVLRAFEPDGIYTTVASNLKSLNYFDTFVVPGETYYYKVICTDIAGNISPDSEPVEVTMLDAGSIVDNVKPEITSVYPQNNAKIGNILTYVLTAYDDIRLSKLAAEYSVDGEEWKEFHAVSSSYSVDGFTKELDTASFTAGMVLKTRGYAVDIKGNISDYKYCDYIIDNVAPKELGIDVEPIARGFVITWTCDETDIAAYKLYRRNAESEFYTVVGEYSNLTLSVVDENLDPSKKYIYKIVAVDSLGNSSITLSEAISPLDIDNVLPTPYINCVSSAEVGTEVEFDASASKDNVGIAKYTWDFGDGTTKEGIRVTHSYITPGEYNIVLKVEDLVGNEEMAQKSINIMEKNISGILNITVTDNLGKYIPNANIYVNVGTPDQFKILADSRGKMSLKLEPGAYDIGAYKEGYSPKQQDVLISENEENNLSFVLEESKIVLGNITTTKLTFEEIKAAGIDVTAPGNQNVFRYEINLNYNNKPYSIAHTSSSSGSLGSGSYGNYSVGGRDVAVRTVTNPKTNETFILLIDIPGRVTWLKEFFNVKLHLINTEGSYDLKECVTTLKVPEGISIAGSNDQSVSVGSIEAKGSKSIEWIIRGDVPGSYNISADFSGILETFNEQISASFVTENPIVVDNSSGLRLIIEVEKAKYAEDDLFYRVGFKNEKNSEIYMPDISMGDSTFIRSYKTKDDMSLVKTSRTVLAPGEILWEEYSADSELFEGYSNRSMGLKELASTALGGLEMPIETRMVEYGTFGRVKTQIYVMDIPGGRKVDLLTLTKYRSKENDKMPSLKITSGRGISEDAIVHEECELTITDNINNVTNTVKTDNNGEYIYDGYNIDDIQVGDSGIGNFSIVVSSDTTRKIKSTQQIRVVDQNLLPAEDFGTISGRVLDKDIYKPIENAIITVDTYKTHTDSDGRFRFEDILLQDDEITIEAEGFPTRTISEELRDGSYVTILMSRMPEVTKVTSAVSDSRKPTSSILPLNLVTGSITFKVSVDLKGAGEVTKYLYKIVSKTGTIKYTGESESSRIKVENIRSKMSIGDRILFAIEAEGTYGTAVSDYVDAKLVMAKEFPFLNAVSWLNDLETALEENLESVIEGDELDGFMEFATGEGMPEVKMPDDSGPIKSLGLESAGFDFDLDVKYDFYNAKATFTTKAGAQLGVNGSFAEFDVPDNVEKFLGTGITAESDVTLTLICVYNDSTLNWEIEKYEIAIASKAEIRILSFEFKYSVPLDAYFGGLLLSGYVSLEINGTLTFITNVNVGGLGSFDSLEEIMIKMQLIIGATLRAAIGLEVGYGLLGGEFWAQGGIDITIPTGKTVLSLAIGHKETYVWFISHEDIIAEKEWVVFDPENRQAPRDDNNGGIFTSGVRSPEKKSVKRKAYAAPDVNAASQESLFKTSPRDYLEKQKWIGEKDIIQYAYPQSDAKISEMDEKYGDLFMVFVGDDSERTDNNRTALFYSINDNGKWSLPKQIENDGTADAFADISSDQDNTFAIWLDMTEKIGDLPEVSADYITKNIISKMKVQIAKFDHQKGTWENVSSPETEGLNKLPQIAAEGGKTIATWVNNYGKEAVGTEENPDDVYFVYNNGTGWTEPKAFITNAENINDSDLLIHNGKAYYVYTTNAYSQDGLYKLYGSVFDGKSWSKPRGILDNIYNDSHPSIAVENGKPVVFWHNDGLIYKAQLQSGMKEIVVNSDKAFGLQELQATNTDDGIALAWTNAIGGEQRLFISTYEDESSTWTQGIELKHNSMEIPRDITLAGNGNEIMAVYNKSVYKQEDENSKYYYEGTSLTSTSYVRKIDLAIPANGIYFENETFIPGEETKVYVAVENIGDLTAKNISVALYEDDKLISKKEMSGSISHGGSLIAEFDCMFPANYPELKLKGVVEVANDGDTSNNSCQLELSFADVEITKIYNALYEKNRGYVYVDVTNNGFSPFSSAKVEIYTDKEFKNFISSKEIKNLYPALTKKCVVEFEVSDEQVAKRVRLYAKVIVDQTEFDYTNNSNFTIVRPGEYTVIPIPVTPEPTPVTPEPTPVTPEPTPVTPEPTPVTPEPTPVTPEPTPITPEPTPVTPKPTRRPDDTGPSGGGSSGTGSSGSSGTIGSTPTSTAEPTPTPTAEPTPTPEVTETPDIIPGSNGKRKGYMRGYEDKSFRPENNITRAEMAVILSNLDQVTKNELEDIAFTDVSQKHWAAWAIKYAAQEGYFKGYEDNTFRPDNYITRAELSVVLCKYLNYDESAADASGLTDIAGHWAKGYINMLTSKGYIKGYINRTFLPDNNIKRSECTALINRALGNETSEDIDSQFTDVDENHWAFKDIMVATQN